MPAVPDSTRTPNSVTSASEILARFRNVEPRLVTHISDAGMERDNRAVVVAAQLLAIATQLERNNVALERIALAVETIARQEMNQ